MKMLALSVFSVVVFAAAIAGAQNVERVKVVRRSNPELVERMRKIKLSEDMAKKGGKDIFAIMIDREKDKIIKSETERCKTLGLEIPTSCDFDEARCLWRMTADNGATYTTTNMTTTIARIMGGKRRAEAAMMKEK